MANYKGLTFPNTTEGFKRWCKEFPPLSPSAVIKVGYKKSGDYYLELKFIEDGMYSYSRFVVTHIRKYNHEDKDFEIVIGEIEKELLNTVFKNKVSSFKEKCLG